MSSDNVTAKNNARMMVSLAGLDYSSLIQESEPHRLYTAHMAIPMELRGLGKDQVTFVWNDQSKPEDADVWPARTLRLRCTCAHCKSEDTGERLIVDEEIPENITVTQMQLVGNYGVGIHFSDGHTTGIYRFSSLKTDSK